MNLCRGIAGESITGSASSNNQRFLCLAQKRDRLPYIFRMGEHRLFRAVFIRFVNIYLLFVYASFLQVNRDGQVNRAAPAAESQAHRPANKFRNPSRIIDDE